MRCPNCQQGELKGEKMGWRCDFCKKFLRVDEVLVYYEEEETEEPSTDAESN